MRKFILKKNRESVQKFFGSENNENTTIIKFVKLNYVKRVTYKICNKSAKFCGRSTCTNKKNFSKILSKRQKKEENSKSDMYKINCNDCRAVYYDQTERSLNTQDFEHAKSISEIIKGKGFSVHCIDKRHSINTAHLIHQVKKGVGLNQLEEEIRCLQKKKFVTNK